MIALTDSEKEEVALLWQSRRLRSSHPDGSFDTRGRWFPSPSEGQSCCDQVRNPSRVWPYTLLRHCRTKKHLRNLVHARRPVPDGEYYKAVAVTTDGYRSIYDGRTAYLLGETRSQEVRPGHGGGYYVYTTPEEAAQATVPSSSALPDAPRVVLELRCEGPALRYGEKIAFTHVTPLRVVGDQ